MATSGATSGRNVLVLAPSLGDARTEACHELLSAEGRLDVLRISYSDPPEQLVDAWRTNHGDLPAKMGIVSVGDQAGIATSDAEFPEGVFVTEANPNDITGLGMRLNNYLGDVDPDSQLVVCFDSLTELCQFVDVQSAFKFVHMLTGQLRELDAVAHFHVDPAALDDRDLSRLKPVFDEAMDAT